MTRKRAISLALVFALSGAFIGALLMWYVWAALGPIPGPAGEPYGRKVSPDGQWIVQSYLDDYSDGWATVEPAGGGVRRTIYYGEAANTSWRDGRVVVTEQESRAEHVIVAHSGTWDYRVDDPLNFYGTIGMWAIPIVLVLGFDIWWLRRWLRRSAEKPASTDPRLHTHLVQE